MNGVNGKRMGKPKWKDVVKIERNIVSEAGRSEKLRVSIIVA